MRSLVFEGNTWEAYEKMREKDKNLHKALRKLLREMLRSEDPSTGTGKPEPLKHNLSGLYSKRISQKDRLIYRFDERYIYILAIGGHYNQP
jgi:toxin YoeB